MRAFDLRSAVRALTAPRPRWICLCVGALVGAMAMVSAFGWTFVLGTSEFWEYPKEDPKIHTMGLVHFVREPWHWPPGITRSVSPPEGLSITFTDSIPILAFPLKLIAPALPSSLGWLTDRPFGFWLFVVYALNGLFLARFARRLGNRSVWGAAVTALFGCTLPTLLVRWIHPALCAHFLLVWGVLLVVIARSEPPSRKQLIEWLALLGIAALTHPYLLAMVATLFLSSLATSAIHHRGKILSYVAVATAGACATLVALFALLGILSKSTLIGHPWGFGVASFNPASIVLSRWSTLLSFLPTGHGDATGFQYEGYDYLGAGLLFACVAAAVLRAKAFATGLRRHAALALALFALTLFALSNHVYIGKSELLSFDVPSFAEKLTSQFRSSGRFIWPATYALLVFVLAQLARLKHGNALLFGAAVVQLVDTRGHYAHVAEATSTHETQHLDWDAWRPILRTHDALWSSPTFDCLEQLRPSDNRSFLDLYELGFIAALEGLAVNSAPNPRPRRSCADEIRERSSLVVRDDTAIVLQTRIATGSLIASIEKQGARCQPASAGYVCSRKLDGKRSFEQPFTRAFVAYPYSDGEWLHFGGTASTGAVHEGPGWGPNDANRSWIGRSAEGARTSIHFVVGPGAARGGFALEVEVDGNLERTPASEMRVEANGVDVGVLRPRRESELYRFCLPSDLPSADRFVIVDLVRSLPAAADPLALEIALRRARLVAGSCEAFGGGQTE